MGIKNIFLTFSNKCKNLKQQIDSQPAVPVIILNCIFTIINVITLLFNCFPNLNPFVSDLKVKSENSDTHSQAIMANMYYNSGKYEDAYETYLMLSENNNKEISGIAFNNIAVICNNCYLNFDDNISDNNNLIYTIFTNLHNAVDCGNEIAKNNLELFSKLYEDPTIERSNEQHQDVVWVYDGNVTSETPLPDDDDKKYVFAGAKVSSGDSGSNKYIYTYNVYVKNSDVSSQSAYLKYDVEVNSIY